MKYHKHYVSTLANFSLRLPAVRKKLHKSNKSSEAGFPNNPQKKHGPEKKIIDESYASKIRTVALDANKEVISASVAYAKKMLEDDGETPVSKTSLRRTFKSIRLYYGKDSKQNAVHNTKRVIEKRNEYV
jgi:hypothetical protein